MTIFNIFRKEYIFKRPNAGVYQNGSFVTSSYNLFRAKVSIQPTSGLQVQYDESGRREQGELQCYTNFNVKTVSDANPDILIAFGYEWQLHQVNFWTNNIINHNAFLARKIGKAEDFIDETRIIVTGEIRITALDETRIVNG